MVKNITHVNLKWKHATKHKPFKNTKYQSSQNLKITISLALV